MMRIFQYGCLTLAVMLTASGCTPQTPVAVVTSNESGVIFQESEITTLPNDWPGWRGIHHDGHVPDQPLLTSWSDTENIIWKKPLAGRGHSSPIVVGSFVCLADADENQQIQRVLAFDKQSGEKVWEKVVNTGGFPPAGQMHPKSTHANSTLACDGKQLYIAFLHHDSITAYALNLETGDLVWEQKLGAFASQFGYAASPILYHSFVIFAADNKGGGYLAAVDRETGKIAWRVSRQGETTYSTPNVFPINGQDQLVISGINQVSSYNPRTGEQNWSRPCLTKATCGTVISNGEQIFASGGFPDRETVALDGAGQLLWKQKVKIYEPSLIAVQEHLYGVTDDGIAHCWQAETGQEMWKHRLQGNFSASPILCNGLIYVSNLSGQTFVFRANPAQYDQLAVNTLGNDCYTSAAVVESRMYLRIGRDTDAGRVEELVCLGEE